MNINLWTCPKGVAEMGLITHRDFHKNPLLFHSWSEHWDFDDAVVLAHSKYMIPFLFDVDTWPDLRESYSQRMSKPMTMQVLPR